MAEPLEYHNPQATPAADELAADVERRAARSPTSAGLIREAFGGRGEMVAVPAAFDARLELSADVATTAAIEAALRHADVPVFRGRDASARGGGIDLHVRLGDLQSAQLLAAYVMERRQRFRAAISERD